MGHVTAVHNDRDNLDSVSGKQLCQHQTSLWNAIRATKVTKALSSGTSQAGGEWCPHICWNPGMESSKSHILDNCHWFSGGFRIHARRLTPQWWGRRPEHKWCRRLKFLLTTMNKMKIIWILFIMMNSLKNRYIGTKTLRWQMFIPK